ncbi:MAG: hypothetical protein ACI9YT_002362, partial [Halobacteriales archaeon]
MTGGCVGFTPDGSQPATEIAASPNVDQWPSITVGIVVGDL